MPKKIGELKRMLLQAGFELEKKRGKGSHTIWKHPLYNGSITLSGKDGKDAKPYQEKDVEQAIKKVKNNET
ncbi:MAG: type II toxin-antitoxin system HicA family toxin [Xenococcaceae cyanobacterium MO_167.B27]|nr:type II toxin-antitoxin system HicA family toxin [Xenococcaceae cyanobacterium MO_167.B27]